MWHRPLSHQCREGKTLVVRPPKKTLFLYVSSLRKTELFWEPFFSNVQTFQRPLSSRGGGLGLNGLAIKRRTFFRLPALMNYTLCNLYNMKIHRKIHKNRPYYYISRRQVLVQMLKSVVSQALVVLKAKKNIY